jgi:hypothetical protein
MKKDKKVTFSIVVPKNIFNEVDELVANSDGILRNRSHAWAYIYQEWKQAKLPQEKKMNSPQLKVA